MEWRSAVAFLIVGLVIGLAAGYLGFRGGAAQQGATATTMPAYTSTAATTAGAGAVGYTVKLAYDEKVGFYLTDAKGRRLYIFAKDYNGTSACYGACAKKRPPFYVESLKVPPGLDPKDFGVITRKDGSKQLTYKGWPLYYYAGDHAPGDINGDGVKNV